MTFTKEMTIQNNKTLAGLRVVLRPIDHLNQNTPLNCWLSNLEFQPVWIPLTEYNGVVKTMPTLLHSQNYPFLLQAICEQLTQNTAVEWQGKSFEVSGVEIESSELYTIQLFLNPTNKLPATLGRGFHALFLKWIASANPDLAEQLHQKSHNPFTISSRPTSSGRIRLRITLLSRELLSPLLWGLNQDLGTEITLAKVPCQISKHVEILASTSYEKLFKVPHQDILNLNFLSPTSFKQDKDIQPFPLPELVFNSLLRRWNVFAPQELHFPSIEWQAVVSAFELKTHALKLEGGAEIGSQGWVRYRFSDPEQAKIASILAQFAFYAGVGRKTTMGMGQVKVHHES